MVRLGGVYFLTATLDGDEESVTFTAEDDTDAVFGAIAHIMDNAHADQLGPWSLGAIELADMAGHIIHTMPAKEGATR